MKRPALVFVVTHDGKKPLAAIPFAEAPMSALDHSGRGIMVVAADAAGAMKTVGRMLAHGVVTSPREGADLFREGYAAALRDLSAYVKAESDSSGEHPYTLRRLGEAAQRQRIAEWISSHEPTEPLPYPHKDG